MGKESRKKQYDQIDEHDAPTEPLRDIRPMFFPAPDDSNSIRGGRTTVGPFSPYPNPQQPLPAYPYTQDYSPNAGTQNYYPFLPGRSEEHTSELQSQSNLVCRLLLEKKK